MDLRKDRLEVKGRVTKLLGHTGVTRRAKAKVGFVDGQGQMWEVLWEVDLAGIVTLVFGLRSFSFHCVEYSDALDQRSSGAKTQEED